MYVQGSSRKSLWAKLLFCGFIILLLMVSGCASEKPDMASSDAVVNQSGVSKAEKPSQQATTTNSSAPKQKPKSESSSEQLQAQIKKTIVTRVVDGDTIEVNLEEKRKRSA